MEIAKASATLTVIAMAMLFAGSHLILLSALTVPMTARVPAIPPRMPFVPVSVTLRRYTRAAKTTASVRRAGLASLIVRVTFRYQDAMGPVRRVGDRHNAHPYDER